MGLFKAAITKSALKKALKKQCITVNNKLGTSATYITGGETIVLSITNDDSNQKKLILNLEVLFEDDHLAVIQKPAGLLVSGNTFKTVTNALGRNLKKCQRPDATKAQPVHRLDFETTGVLLIGKTSSSIRHLNKLFEHKTIKKTYHAITIGSMITQGSITVAIDDKPSLSNYKLIDSVTSKRFGTLNLLELEPQTGRHHQLRKHLAHIGHPILGDKVYGKAPLILKGKGLYLHASTLEFIHPFTHKKMRIESELPKRFKKIFKPKVY